MTLSILELIQIILQSGIFLAIITWEILFLTSCVRAVATLYSTERFHLYPQTFLYIPRKNWWAYGNVLPMILFILLIKWKSQWITFLFGWFSPLVSYLWRLDSVASEQLWMSSKFGRKNSLFILHIFMKLILTSSQLHIKENSSSVPASVA